MPQPPLATTYPPPYPPIALKEWPAAIAALADGTLGFIVRKGGLLDSPDGTFHLQHEVFFLWPSHAHQRTEQLKPGCADAVGISDAASDPGPIQLTYIATVAGPVRALHSYAEAQSGGHIEAGIWQPAFWHMRFAYRPEHPVLIVPVTARAAASSAALTQTAEQAGCRSWVALPPEIFSNIR